VASPMVGNAAALAPIALMTSRRDAMESPLGSRGTQQELRSAKPLATGLPQPNKVRS
jgi:hypothetical protein